VVLPPRSQLRRTLWYTALVFASMAVLFRPQAAGARVVLVTDTTPPIVTYTVDGIEGNNNWYRGNVGGNYVVVRWSVSDPESPITSTSGCEPAIQINGPNTGTTRTCSATSDGGTTTVTTRLLKIDATPPANLQANAVRPPDHNGWYNQSVNINWGGTDATSGIDSCSSRSYSGPDSGNGSTTGTCTDMAGNVSAAFPFTLSYDATRPNASSAVPGRAPDDSGWYNHSVGINWSGNDGTSGIDSCTVRTYNGPDVGGGTTNGTCTDEAGNTSTALSFPISYDGTAPVVNVSAARATDHNGWYNHAVTITWTGSDPISGVESCTSRNYTGPDVANGSTSGTCTDHAGNTAATVPFPISYDDNAPTATVTPARATDRNGWYNHSVGVTWSGSDPISGIESCTSRTYSGPDVSNGSTSGTCTDRAGNPSASVAFPLSYDATLPNASIATPARAPDHNGWYNHAVAINWSGTDGTSGIESCTSRSYSSPDVANGNTSGTCTDRAGNVSTALAFALSYDSTNPAVAVTPARGPDRNGWYNQSLGLAWSGTDATSGIDSCSGPSAYNGPDSATARATGTCADEAGNVGSGLIQLSYDATRPNATDADAARAPDRNGWYNHAVGITWSGTDATSGVESCTSRTYSGPDADNGTSTGTCTDRAGNTSAAFGFALSYDATRPAVSGTRVGRTPDHNGWYNHAVAIDWNGTDATSGIDFCTSRTYSGPDVANGSTSGTCTDVAGNASANSLAFTLSYDATDPVVAVTAARSADHGGWYNQPVGISWSGTDATSGIASCSAPITYSGPDRANASSVGGCTDNAGNSASPPALAFRYDATAPVVSIAPGRGPDANGWYNHALRIAWTALDPTSGIDSCTSLLYSGPDSGAVGRTGGCTDRAGNASAPSTFRFRFDSTAPGGVAVIPARPPDHDGWYNHPLPIRWFASDLLAGIASCTSLTYGAPDETGGRLVGGCTDRAGNRSVSLPFALRYDEEPPAFTSLKLQGLDGAVAARWRATGASHILITRSPWTGTAAKSDVYSGGGSAFSDRKVENYVRYRYTLTASDPAGNVVQRNAYATPLPVLYAPRPGARLGVHARPVFAWRPAKKARYYNFQLWVDGRRAGSWWPTRARLRLPSRWSLDGETQRLEPGTYTWYVWPGRGARKLGRYGALLGKSTFVVR
jgi:hypothetical protein